MALVSPGVQVNVIDESFYTPAEPGTVPMIFVVSAQDKANAAGTGTAQATLKANAGKPYLVTSQRELADLFGDPTFYTDANNNPIHGGELNEYGLQAAYSLLGVSNRVYVTRADIDLNELTATADAPAGDPANGTYWFDTLTTRFGIFEWNGEDATQTGGQTFTNKVPLAITSTDQLVGGLAASGPKSSVGSNGDYAVVAQGNGNRVWRKSAGVWYKVGTTQWKAAIAAENDSTQPTLKISTHTQVPQFKIGASEEASSGSVWIKTTTPNLGAEFRVKVWNDTTKLWEEVGAPLYADNQSALFGLDRTGGGLNLSVGDLYVQTNWEELTVEEANYKIFRRENTGVTSITSGTIAVSDYAGSFNIAESRAGASGLPGSGTITISSTSGETTAAGVLQSIIDDINAGLASEGLTKITASESNGKLVLSHADGGEFRLSDATNTPLEDLGFYDLGEGTYTTNLYAAPTGDTTYDVVASNWKPLSYTASAEAPSSLTTDGALWYNSIVDEVDIMVHNGSGWVGYGVAYPDTDPAGPIVRATEPANGDRSDSGNLVDGDLWIDTSDLENYPTIYKRVGANWVLVDKADQTTEDGVIFADARWSLDGTSADAGTITALRDVSVVDPDAPDHALYPQGMLLWNLRRSGFNVKRFVRNYVDPNDADSPGFYEHRWVTESANNADGSGSFGRNAQRKVVVQALQAMVNSNQEIRDDESRLFNVMATPGYPELIGEMITLNYDRGLTAFIVGDSPMRLTPDATSINEWATNVNLAVEDNDLGLVSRDEYLGIFYPSLFTSDNAGNNVVVPASHGILRTIALSDQVSYPWFAPAGTRRGGITNASAAGYIDAEGEFNSVALNEGQRDTLYAQNVNPITFLNGAGLVNYGQKTRARNASALDRINVARLVIYLRSQLNKLAKPYIFEPNDKITRDEIKQQVDSLLLELVGQRALYDFLVVCDESNNTPNRIDRNELYVDIAIEPVKAVEFIYIPLRLKNTGEIAGL
jgi:hypothetical protein